MFQGGQSWEEDPEAPSGNELLLSWVQVEPGWVRGRGLHQLESEPASPPPGYVVFSYGFVSWNLRDPLCEMGSLCPLSLGPQMCIVQPSLTPKRAVPGIKLPGFKS